MSNKVVTGAQVSTEKDLAQQVKELQEQVKNLQKKASIITPEMEELIELYNDIERYGEKCYRFTERSMKRLRCYCGDTFDDKVNEAYKDRFGKIIGDMEDTLERDIMGHFIDQISIYQFGEKEG